MTFHPLEPREGHSHDELVYRVFFPIMFGAWALLGLASAIASLRHEKPKKPAPT